jgi:2-polyprenyl-3-methyl-5-hydroxy-6-metoxy-1,4-benzoquinol methylase
MEFTTAEYPCACCKNNTTKMLVNKMGFYIVQCSQCNFVYVNPRVKNEALENIYKHNYFRNKDYGYIGYEQEKRLRIKNFERWLKDAQQFMPDNKQYHVLDVGCAAGYCLDVMTAKGWNAEGLELDEEMCIGLTNAGKKVYRVLLENFESKLKYQVITLFDVIEHIPNIDMSFKKLSELIHKDGIVIMVTPNHDSVQRKLFSKRWFQYKPIEHIQYFTKHRLEIFAKRNNLRMVYHTKCGQYADTEFLINRLKYYHFSFLSKVFNKVFHLLNLKGRFFYTDTGSLFVIFKKMQD